MKKINLIVILVALFYSFSVTSQESSLQLTIPYGSYEVGFKSINAYDYSRSFSVSPEGKKKEAGVSIFRPMQISIWYPAAKGDSKSHMKYEDYFFLIAHETGEVNLTAEHKEKMINDFIEMEPVALDKFHNELKVNMRAIKEATPAAGKFPVIVYGPSWWSTSFENELMFEFLASHGYVIISSPSMGPDKREMPISRIGIETQAKDMEFLIGIIHDFPNADIDKLALMGFSLGGISDVLTMARNRSVDAWIGLDPSIHELYELFEQSPYEDYSLFSIPTLFINSLGYIDSTPFYDKLVYSDAYMVNLPKLDHTDHASQFIKLYEMEKDESATKVANRYKGYNLISGYVCSFLDGVFKNDFTYDQMCQEVFSLKNLDQDFVHIKTKKGLAVADELFDEFKNKKGKDIITFLDKTISSNGNLQYPEGDIQKLIFLFATSNLMDPSKELMSWYHKNYPDAFHSDVLEWITFNEMTAMFTEIYENNDQQCNFSYDELNHTGHVFTMGDRKEEGIKYFELNVKMRPKDYKAHFNLGVGYYRLEDFENAKKYFTSCIANNPNDRYLNMSKDFLSKLK